VLHERVMLLTVKIEDVPYVEEDKRFDMKDLGSGFYRLIIRFGFMQETNVPLALARVESCGPQFKMMDTSFFLARQTLIASARPGHGGVARESCSPGCCATPKARWNSSSCRPTGWSSSAARWRFERAGPAPPADRHRLRGDDHGWLQGLRRRHFPPERNQCARAPHLVPPSAPSLDASCATARGAGRSPAPAAHHRHHGPGGGTAFRVESEALADSRELAEPSAAC
jgi:hypothetical protein